MSFASLSINQVALMTMFEDYLGVISSSIIFLSMHCFSLSISFCSMATVLFWFYTNSRSEC
jgi:hypothetical protein